MIRLRLRLRPLSPSRWILSYSQFLPWSYLTPDNTGQGLNKPIFYYDFLYWQLYVSTGGYNFGLYNTPIVFTLEPYWKPCQSPFRPEFDSGVCIFSSVCRGPGWHIRPKQISVFPLTRPTLASTQSDQSLHYMCSLGS